VQFGSRLRKRKKILLIFSSIIIIGTIYILDKSDRGLLYSEYIPAEEISEFYLHENNDKIQESFKKNFGNPKYDFPRCSVKKIKVLDNVPLVSRLTSNTITEKNKIDFILDFFNNPKNFDWGETTWSINESEYIFRFYDEENNEIGTVWLCFKGCGMTDARPFSPNMKFGGLSELGKLRMKELLNKTIKL
jgi:hypothetical protein